MPQIDKQNGEQKLASHKAKKNLIKQLEAHYGKNFKTPLAKDLGVNITTIRRMFNEREEIPAVYLIAINCILHHQDKCD